MTNTMKQVDMREEVKARGLITYGDSSMLERRLAEDDTRGVFRGVLTSMSEKHLRQLCISRSIPSVGKRQQLIDQIEKYNQYKRGHRVGEARKVSINDGLPTSDDWLGKPTGEKIPGTLGSGKYLGSYDRYIQGHVKESGTTENAFTLRYWRECQHPDSQPQLIVLLEVVGSQPPPATCSTSHMI